MLEIREEFPPDHEHQAIVPTTVDEGSPCGAAITGQDGSKGRPRAHVSPLSFYHCHVVGSILYRLLELANEWCHAGPRTDRPNGRGWIEWFLDLATVTREFVAFLLQIYLHDAPAQLTIQSHRREADPGSGKMACQLAIGHLCRNRLKCLNAVLQIHNPHDRHFGFR